MTAPPPAWLSSALVAQVASEAEVIVGLSPVALLDRVVGQAFTCACAPGDNLALHSALASAPRGSVLVCAAGGRIDGGYFGALMATDAVQRCLAGLVIDGSVRDTVELRALGFPVFAAGMHPRPCAKRTIESVGEAVCVRGATVHTGDVVVADADGIVVVRGDGWDEVVVRAHAHLGVEREIQRDVEEGTPLATRLGLLETSADETPT